GEIKRLHIRQGSTTIYVTHDQVEAMSLADRIVIMHAGILQQVGTPSEVYEKPANMFVAQFVGSPVMNLSPVDVRDEDGRMKVAMGGNAAFEFPAALSAKLSEKNAQQGSISLGIRAEGVEIALDQQPGFVPLTAGIIEPLGSHDIVDLKVGDTMLRARTKSGFVSRPGEKVWARIDASQTHFFDTTTGNSLGVSF
ncbi:MAG: ABC transporter ATP-binding protein, partial [Deltaproteobacteria bacterium]